MIKKLWPVIVRETDCLMDDFVVTQWILLPWKDYEVDKDIKDMTKNEILSRYVVQLLEEIYYFEEEEDEDKGQYQHESTEMIKIPMTSEIWYRKMKDGLVEDGFEIALEVRLIENYEIADAYIFESYKDAKDKVQQFLSQKAIGV